MSFTKSVDDVAAPNNARIAAAVERVRGGATAGVLHDRQARRRALKALRAMLTERDAEFTRALATDLGKSDTEAYLTEIGFLINEIDHTLGQIAGWMRPTRVHLPLSQNPGKASVRHEALGAVLIIAPWNYPLLLSIGPLIAAVAGGNSAIVAPSEVAPATAAAIERLLPDYLDSTIVQVVNGDATVKQALLAERFDHIFYTGNGTVGREVMVAAAQHLTPVTLELGGKSPAIVAASADLDIAARRISWGKFTNAGQTCVAPDYVLVESVVAERFVTALVETIRQQWGANPQLSDDYGRIVNAHHLRRLTSLLAGGGGKVALGGDSDFGDRYLAPTVVVDPDLESGLMEDEIFGPILPIVTIDSTSDAIEFINARPDPLALYLFSSRPSEIDTVLDRTSSGGAAINHTVMQMAVPDLPFGGVGASGIGAYHGRAGFETFTHRRSVLKRSNRPDLSIAYPPYGRTARAVLRRFF